MTINFWDKTPNQRRTLRNWSWVFFGPSLILLVAFILWALVYVFAGAEPQRIHWLGWLGMAMLALLGLVIMVFGMEISLSRLRFKASKEGVEIDADEDDKPEETP